MNILTIPNAIFFAQVEEEIKEGREVRFNVKGFSMYPLFRNEIDEVLLKPIPNKEDLKRGDIVLFRYHNRHIMHRILEKRGKSLKIRGDNVFTSCEFCSLNDVVGIVKFAYRRKGSITERDFKEVNPYTLKWNIFIALWRFLYYIYKYSGARFIWHSIRKKTQKSTHS